MKNLYARLDEEEDVLGIPKAAARIPPTKRRAHVDGSGTTVN